MNPMSREGATGRIAMIDVARFYGIVLVYYGHVVERMMYLGSSPAAHQYKFIYSFHMLLFFVVAGFIASESVPAMSPGRFVRSRLTSRVVPLLFFNLLLAALSLVFPRDFPPFPLVTPADYWAATVSTLTTLPIFDIPTWFLMCLITVEVLHYLVFRFLRASDARILAAVVVFYLGGYLLNREFQFVDFERGLTNYWFFNEAPVAYAFYLLGVFLRRRRFLLGARSPLPLLAAGLVLLAVVALTYDLNQGPFRLIEAVVILASGHGHILWFPLTAVAGSLMILIFARATPPVPWLTYLGRNALTLFGLNGIVYHHVNGPMAAWVSANLGTGSVAVFAGGAVVTVVSLALAVPLVVLFNRAIPQLIGRPSQKGPLLPNLI